MQSSYEDMNTLNKTRKGQEKPKSKSGAHLTIDRISSIFGHEVLGIFLVRLLSGLVSPHFRTKMDGLHGFGLLKALINIRYFGHKCRM